MHLAAEYDGFSVNRKALQVSWLKESQRSTYYLALPYRYSVPFTIASMGLR
jgi:hypothetical protein